MARVSIAEEGRLAREPSDRPVLRKPANHIPARKLGAGRMRPEPEAAVAASGETPPMSRTTDRWSASRFSGRRRWCNHRAAGSSSAAHLGGVDLALAERVLPSRWLGKTADRRRPVSPNRRILHRVRNRVGVLIAADAFPR
jgi:hypothetical protein